MNDWWNDPPDDAPEGPECPLCKQGVGELVSQTDHIQTFICDACGQKFEVEASEYLDPDWEENFDPKVLEEMASPEPPEKCPHGKSWSECNDCMIASDLAYDAERERASFRR